MGNRHDSAQPIRDLDAVRSFLSSSAPAALFDLPWLPLYLFILSAFRPLLGATALIGAISLIGLTILTDVYTREPTMQATRYANSRDRLAEAGQTECRGDHGHGPRAPYGRPVGRGKPQLHGGAAAGERRRRRPQRDRPGVAHGLAVRRAWPSVHSS